MDSQIFELSRIAAELRSPGDRYLEFLRVPALSVGLYALPKGGVDAQQPHTEDEVYYVLAGRSQFQSGAHDRAVQPGAVIYVKAGVEHRFHSIEDDLRVLVFFAPAEGTNRP